MFAVPPPFLSRGLGAYMATWEPFLSWSDKPVAFDFHDVKITARKDAAFARATGRCAGVDPNGKREELGFSTALRYSIFRCRLLVGSKLRGESSKVDRRPESSF